MEPTTTDNMTCFLLGHNYYKSSELDDSQEKAICKNCGSKTYLNLDGEFNANPNDNKSFINALRKLFILKRGMKTSLK